METRIRRRSFLAALAALTATVGAPINAGRQGGRTRLILLGTGGGIKNVEDLLRTEPFIVYSGDLLTDFALEPLIDEHFRKENDVTLALRKTGLAAEVALKKGRIVDIENKYGHAGEYDFANVSIWNRTRQKAEPLAAKGGKVVDRPDALVSFEELHDIMGMHEIEDLEQRFLTAGQLETKYGKGGAAAIMPDSKPASKKQTA